MAFGTKISELPAATSLTGLELTVVVQGGETRRSTVEAMEASVSQRVDVVSALASANAAAVVSTNAVVGALELRVSAVSAQASVLGAALTSTNVVVSALDTRVGLVSALISVNAAAITSVNNAVSALELRVSAVSTRASANAAAITSINNVVSALELRVSAVSTRASTNAAAITSINNVVSALEIRVSAASAAATSINNVVSVLTGRVANVSASVSALAITVAAVSALVSVNAAAITSVNAVVSLKVNRAGDTMTGNLTVPSLNSGPLAGFRNVIINGNFDIWQRDTSFASPANGSYVADRWRVDYTGTGATRTISRQAFTLGQTDVPGEPTYFLRFDQSVAGSGAAGNAITQRIEGVRTFAGQTITISFWGKAAASLTLPRIAVFQYFGLGGSPSASTVTVAASNVAVGTSWAKYTYTLTMPSLSGKTIGTNGTDGIWLEIRVPINTTFTFDLAQVQLEAGPVATPFESRPIGTELALCQRYYLKSNAGTSNGFNINGGDGLGSAHPTASFRGGAKFPIVMCGTPTLTIYDSAGNSARVSIYTTTWLDNQTISVGPSATATGFYLGHNIANSIETRYAYTASAEL